MKYLDEEHVGNEYVYDYDVNININKELKIIKKKCRGGKRSHDKVLMREGLTPSRQRDEQCGATQVEQEVVDTLSVNTDTEHDRKARRKPNIH